MPSIRIRNSAYSTLRDSPVTPSATQSRLLALTTLFSPPNEDQNLTASPTAAGPPAPPRMQRSMPAMRDVLTESSPPITRQGRQTARNTRPRSNTTESRSRVSSFVTGSQGRRYPTTKGTPASDVQSLLRQPDYQPSPTTPATDYGRTPATLGSDRNQVRDRSPSARFSVRPPSDKDSSTDSSSDDAWTHHDDVVEHLDVIDPQVATVSSLTNAANNLLFPPLPYYSRRPVLVLQPLMTQVDPSHGDLEVGEEMHLDDTLDRHVDDVIKRPSPIRRTLMGVWSFVKTPMGFITAVYGFCVVFWGAAIVLFAGKLINLHNPSTQGFWVEVSSQIENGLFTATGIGLIPFRAFDTYRIYWIWHYKRKTKRLRAERGLPQLLDVDDLPDPKYDPNYVHVLTEKEEHDLYRQQRKFQHSQTWYRPHGTETHRAFPINTALLICLLSDGNSFFQILLCGCMWGLDRYTRPAWTTGTLIPCSFVCGILAGVFIWRGDKQTKRVEAVKERLQAALNTSLEQSPHDDGDNAHTPSRLHEKIHEAEEPSEEPSENEQESEGSNAPHLAVDEHMTIPTVLEKDGHGAKNGN